MIGLKPETMIKSLVRVKASTTTPTGDPTLDLNGTGMPSMIRSFLQDVFEAASSKK